MVANLMDVARRAGVSVATASRVLSGSNYPVSEDTRRRVEASAAELHYIPNAQAQGLLRGNPRAVGVVVGDVGDPYFSEMIAGLQTLATELQYLVTVINTRRSVQLELDAVRVLRANRVGISIIAGSGLVEAEYAAAMTSALSAAIDAGEAVVTIGRHALGVEVSGVSVDNVQAGLLLGDHLKRLGHRNVAVLSGSMNLTSVVDRVEGLRQSLGSGLVVREVVATRDGAWAAMEPLLDAHPDLTAVVGTADQMAMGALAWLRSKDISVPGMISVAGVNDIWVAKDMTPSLTTVRLPLAEMGATALRLGIGALKGKIEHKRLPVELVVRGSTGVARR